MNVTKELVSSMKKHYQKPDVTVYSLDAQDVVTASISTFNWLNTWGDFDQTHDNTFIGND